MSPIESLKAEAIALRAREKMQGRAMKHSAALEQIARNHGFRNWRAACALLEGDQPAAVASPLDGEELQAAEMKRYKSSEWGFALDIPPGWNSFPPVSANSPYEVIRFASHEAGRHLLIVFRQPRDSRKSVKDHTDQAQQILTRHGFGNFVLAETALRSRPSAVLSFDRPEADGLWSCREYFIGEGGLIFVLGFGTTRKTEMAELYDRMAQSFQILST